MKRERVWPLKLIWNEEGEGILYVAINTKKKGGSLSFREAWIKKSGIKTEKDIKENKLKTRKEKMIRELISW